MTHETNKECIDCKAEFTCTDGRRKRCQECLPSKTKGLIHPVVLTRCGGCEKLFTPTGYDRGFCCRMCRDSMSPLLITQCVQCSKNISVHVMENEPEGVHTCSTECTRERFFTSRVALYEQWFKSLTDNEVNALQSRKITADRFGGFHYEGDHELVGLNPNSYTEVYLNQLAHLQVLAMGANTRKEVISRLERMRAEKRRLIRQLNAVPVGHDVKAIYRFLADCPEGYQADHIHPLSKGGLHSLGNLRYISYEENKAKGFLLPDQWAELRPYWVVSQAEQMEWTEFCKYYGLKLPRTLRDGGGRTRFVPPKNPLTIKKCL